MSDMYGAVRSNWFKVKNAKEFKAWFCANVSFGSEMEVWEQEGLVALGSYEAYPSAWPQTIPEEMPEDCPDPGMWDCEHEAGPWDLEMFAAAIRCYLEPGQEFRVLAAGHEKLRYVAFQHLVVTETTVVFTDGYEGN